MSSAPANLPPIPKATLGRGIVTTKFGLGTAVWPKVNPYDEVVRIFRAAFDAGVTHVDTAPLYGSEEIVGRAMADAGRPAGLTITTKCCAYSDELGIVYREYSDRTVYKSVERSLKRLKVDHIDVLHVHDHDPADLPAIEKGALKALVDLRSQGVIRSVGMAVVNIECLTWAVNTGQFDQIQCYHNHTLLNDETRRDLIPAARARKMGVFHCAPYAGWILQTGAVPGALYNYYPADPEVMEATRRLEQAVKAKNVSLADAAVLFSFLSPDVDVTIIGASSIEKLYHRISLWGTHLKWEDMVELASVAKAAGAPFPTKPSWSRNPENSERTALL